MRVAGGNERRLVRRRFQHRQTLLHLLMRACQALPKTGCSGFSPVDRLQSRFGDALEGGTSGVVRIELLQRIRQDSQIMRQLGRAGVHPDQPENRIGLPIELRQPRPYVRRGDVSPTRASMGSIMRVIFLVSACRR